MTSRLCIGLFGTCGKSTWRQDLFIPLYKDIGLESGVDFFNPQVDSWKPSDAEIEAEYLAEDQIICFPVTEETYGTGSLAETGFSVLQALKFDDRREILILIDKLPAVGLDVDVPELGLSKVAYKESARARSLVLQHLKKITYQNVRICQTLNEMLEWSIFLFRMKLAVSDFEKYRGSL